MLITNPWVVITLSLIFSSFFSGIEIAFLSANKLKIELKHQRGSFYGKVLSFFIKNPSHFLTTTLLGNSIALVIYSIYAAELVGNGLTQAGFQSELGIFLSQTILSTLFVLIVAEFLPKAIFHAFPDKVLTVFYLPFSVFYVGLYPVVLIIVFLSKWILRFVFRVKIAEESPVYNRLDLFHIVGNVSLESKREDNELDTQIFKNAIEFHSKKVRECMVPRKEMIAVNIEDSIEDLKGKFIETGVSRMIVYEENIDNIKGYVHLVDLYKNPDKIKDILIDVSFTAGSTPASELLRTLISGQTSMAVVVDEYGGTLGIITVEDVIEEIIGEIEDEHDTEDMIAKKISDNEYIFSGRQEIELLNENFDLSLPEGDYETLSGLLFHLFESFPEVGQQIAIPPYEFTVLKAAEAKIEEVKVRIIKHEG